MAAYVIPCNTQRPAVSLEILDLATMRSSEEVFGMAPVAEFQAVRKVYPGRTEALKGVDLVVGEGESLGLIGPNGAGKTTLVRLLLGLLKPTSGSVKLWERDAYALPVDLKRGIGFLLEETGVYENLTVEENLLFWAKLYDIGEERVPEVLSTWGLLDKRKALARTLSAGMKQRLGVAKALMHEAPFAVLDEPTSNLDPEARRDVVDLLQDRGKGRILLISSHNLFDIERVCTRVALLRRGAITAQGTMEDLKKQLGVKREVRIRVSGEISGDLERRIVDRFGVTRTADNELILVDEATATRDLVRYLVEHGVDVERAEESRVTLEDVYTQMVEEDEAE